MSMRPRFDPAGNRAAPTASNAVGDGGGDGMTVSILHAMICTSLRDDARAVSRRIRRAGQAPFATITKEPIFILGNQKSGTSAIAALLGEITGLSVTVDLLNEERRPLFHRCKKGEAPFSKLVRRNRLDFSRAIVKEPNLTLFYQELVDYFPAAKFVFIVRDPRDNLRSILNWLRLAGTFEEIPEGKWRALGPIERGIVDGRWLGLAGKGYVEMLAGRWNLFSDVYLDHSACMVLQRYEDFVADKPGSVAALAKRLDLTPVNDVRDKVDFQYQPAGDRDTVWSEFFGTRNLERIETCCASRMERLRYGPSPVIR